MAHQIPPEFSAPFLSSAHEPNHLSQQIIEVIPDISPEKKPLDPTVSQAPRRVIFATY